MSSHPDELAPATATQLQVLRSIGVPVGVGVPSTPAPYLVVDALLGYSQAGDPRGEVARLVEWSAGRRVVSLDVPSGLELVTGTVRSPCVRAEATLTLALPKLGLRGAGDVTGELYLGDISVPPLVYERVGAAHISPFGRGPVVRVDMASAA
jgi:NAD(P)H-hydrate epimerase